MGGGVTVYAQSFSQMRTYANVNATQGGCGEERQEARDGRNKEKSVLKNPPQSIPWEWL